MSRKVCLTIDVEYPDRPTEAGELDVIDILREEEAIATLFVEGRWALAHPIVLGALAEDGYLIGNHSHWHVPIPLLSVSGLRRTILESERALGVVGIDPRPWFRLPYGNGWGSEGCHAPLRALGYETVQWDIDSRDWQAESTQEIVGTVLLALEKTEVECPIVVFHSWPTFTAKALCFLLTEFDRQDIELIRLDER